MLFNIILGVLIFGYALWQLIRFIRKSREGKCATCAIKDACTSPCYGKDYKPEERK